MRSVDLVIGVGWLVFWVGWLAAGLTARPGRTRWGRSTGIRVAIILLIVSAGRAGAFRGHTSRDPALAATGLALFLLGMAVAVWARVALGRNWGTPMSEKYDPQLVTSGPYRWVRNPIYSGIILAMVGTAVAMSLQWLLVAALAGAYFVYSAVVEQRYLTGQFPTTYPAYVRSTKMLVPFLF